MTTPCTPQHTSEGLMGRAPRTERDDDDDGVDGEGECWRNEVRYGDCSDGDGDEKEVCDR